MSRALNITFLLAAILVLFCATAAAQTSGALFGVITWRSNSYIPADYNGKALPNSGSDITLALEVFAAGKPDSSLATKQVSWFINNRFVVSGPGKTIVTIAAATYSSSNLLVRAVVDGYEQGSLAASITVPIVKPVVVIDAPYPNNLVDTNAITLRARPYFFSIATLTDVLFTWKLQGKELERGLDNDTLFFGLNEIPSSAELLVDVIARLKSSDLIQSSDSIVLMAK